ncbi:hypothetical protein ATO10_05901 [Actibacterium atlanticum]|uniref:DUF3768 domain-containing protein n=1 Tax=Actibacterium atlanticum TaxID=1461693 RepID=A0A058ZNP7_9RHOB|nr:DUF3768 domain-containing protein [Actibacterium atlanticum]KCV82451.1 hypothetical protein ATO10_05901 [Actibacterium atlanticum]
MEKEDKVDAGSIGSVPVCAECGSERVVTDAWACWNRVSGLWELENSFDEAYCYQCDAATRIRWIRPEEPPNRLVRDLNDAFRQHGSGKGSIMVTQGISRLGAEFVARVMKAVQQYNDYSEDNDPWGEHDFGAIEIEDLKIYWKIDPYDLELKELSPNPANPEVTHRVLTVMLASEY